MTIPPAFTLRRLVTRSLTLTFAISALTVAVSTSAFGQASYTWDGGAGTSSWQDANNWNPNGVPSTTVRDLVFINTPVTVNSTSLHYTNNLATTTYTVMSITDGGNLVVNGDLTIGTAANTTRNMRIGSGSSLSVTGTLLTGVGPSGNASRTSTWTINGSVSAGIFEGNQAATTGTGGYILNVAGGSLLADTFSWSRGASVSPNVTNARINLSLDGVVDIGVMSANWDNLSYQTIHFVDGTGSLTFGKTNWETLASVESLISLGNISKDAAVINAFSIFDGGDHWTVTVVPEPSVFAYITGACLVLYLLRRRRSFSR